MVRWKSEISTSPTLRGVAVSPSGRAVAGHWHHRHRSARAGAEGGAMAERGAIIISWGDGQPGVPVAKGLEIFGNALGFYEQLQKDGRIDGYRVYASMTGKPGGQLVIEGAVDELAKLMVDSESQKHRLLGELVVRDLDVQLY